MVKISVLLPVYKPKMQELIQSVDSILNQTYKDFELIVLYEDDGISECCEYLESITDDRVVVIKLPKGTGLTRSLNVGLDNAKGKYVARMDADDISKPNRFMAQLRFMESNPYISVVGSSVELIGDRKGVLFKRRGITPEIRSARLLFGNYGIAHPTAFIRKSFLDEKCIRYNEEIRGSEDYHLWVDICLSGGLIDTLDETLLYYRISDDQASQRLSREMKTWDLQARRKLLSRLGRFSKKEYGAFDDWGEHKLLHPVEDYVDLLRRIIKNNHALGIYDDRVLRRQCAYAYAIKAYRIGKHAHDWSMMKYSNVRRVIRFREIVYLVKECIKKL